METRVYDILLAGHCLGQPAWRVCCMTHDSQNVPCLWRPAGLQALHDTSQCQGKAQRSTGERIVWWNFIEHHLCSCKSPILLPNLMSQRRQSELLALFSSSRTFQSTDIHKCKTRAGTLCGQRISLNSSMPAHGGCSQTSQGATLLTEKRQMSYRPPNLWAPMRSHWPDVKQQYTAGEPWPWFFDGGHMMLGNLFHTLGRRNMAVCRGLSIATVDSQKIHERVSAFSPWAMLLWPFAKTRADVGSRPVRSILPRFSLAVTWYSHTIRHDENRSGAAMCSLTDLAAGQHPLQLHSWRILKFSWWCCQTTKFSGETGDPTPSTPHSWVSGHDRAEAAGAFQSRNGSKRHRNGSKLVAN